MGQWKLLNTYDFGTTSETSGKVYFTNPIKTTKILVKGTTASVSEYVWAYFSNAASTAGFCFRIDITDNGNPLCRYGVLDEPAQTYNMASIADATHTIEGETWFEIDFPSEYKLDAYQRNFDMSYVKLWYVDKWVDITTIDNVTPFTKVRWVSRFTSTTLDKWFSEASGLTTDNMSWNQGWTAALGYFGGHRMNVDSYTCSFKKPTSDNDIPRGGAFRDQTKDANRSDTLYYDTAVTISGTTYYEVDFSQWEDATYLYAPYAIMPWNEGEVYVYIRDESVIQIVPSSHNFPSSGSSTNITVSTNLDWSASTDDDWYSFTPSSGSGTTNVTVTVPMNTSTTKSGSISFTSNGLTEVFSLTQDAYIPSSGSTIRIGNTSINKLYIGETNVNCVYIGENKLWEAEAPLPVPTSKQIYYQTSDESLISLDLRRMIPTSNTYNNHWGLLSFSGDISSIVMQTFSSVHNTTGKLTKLVIPSSVTSCGMWAFEGLSLLTDYYSYSRTVPVLNEYAFLSVNSALTVHYPIGADYSSWQTEEPTFTYVGDLPNLVVTPTAHTFNATGGTALLSITSNENWTLTNNADWISLSQVSGSSGTTNVLIIIDNYTSTTEDRSATITASTSMFTVLINVQQSKAVIVQQANEIWYTSTDGNVINPNVDATAQTSVFGANITSNTYTDGKGVIAFDGTVTGVGGFSGATTLSAIMLTSAVTTVAQSAFSGCVNLKAFDFTYVSSINSSAFSETSLESINIPAVATILSGECGVFMSCTALTSVTIAEGVRYLGSTTAMLLKGMFENCTSLQNVVLPSTLINVGYACFKGCISLQTLSMGGSLDSASIAMGKDMVSGCTALTSIVINQARPPKLLSTSNPFSGDSGCPIYVPSASVDTYKAATGWKTTAIANRIQAIP